MTVSAAEIQLHLSNMNVIKLFERYIAEWKLSLTEKLTNENLVTPNPGTNKMIRNGHGVIRSDDTIFENYLTQGWF